MVPLNKKKVFLRIFSIFCYLILIYILGNYFYDINWNKLIHTNIDWGIFTGAVLTFLGIRLLYPGIWIFILKDFGQKIHNYWELNLVYAKTWLGRYIPGKVAWIGGKIYFGSQQGLDIKILALSSLLEAIIQLIANLALGPIACKPK